MKNNFGIAPFCFCRFHKAGQATTDSIGSRTKKLGKNVAASAAVRVVAVALLALCLNCSPASAQDAGKFTLPYEAHWGRMTLPAGEYSFRLNSEHLASILTVYRGASTVGMIIAQTFHYKAFAQSGLLVMRGPSGNTIRELRLAPTKMVFVYGGSTPKQDPAPEQNEVAQLIPVVQSGK